eukprot:g20440.t1
MTIVLGETWGDQLRAYEREKRYEVDAGLVSGQPLRLLPGMFQAQERTYDPVLGRYRDGAVEGTQRHAEERERVAHLNRARDIQILREQPFNILSQESKLDKLAPGKDPMRLGGHGTLGEKERTKEGKGNFPDTAVDYNILSNLPFKEQHWAKEDSRPRMKEKSPRVRRIPAFLCKDFDIVTNRYLDNHSEKLRQEKRVNLLEATEKHMAKNGFDPLTGKFCDPKVEERVQRIDDAREVEIHLRGEARYPPSYKGRESTAYGILSHETYNPEMLRLYDTKEKDGPKGGFSLQGLGNLAWSLVTLAVDDALMALVEHVSHMELTEGSKMELNQEGRAELLLLAMFEPAGQEKAASPHIDVELILRTLHVLNLNALLSEETLGTALHDLSQSHRRERSPLGWRPTRSEQSEQAVKALCTA